MKTWTVAAALLLVSTCGFSQTAQTAPTAGKTCDDLKSEIAKKLDAKNVVGYTLDIVDKGKEGDAKVVGSCNGGRKSITYTRGGAAQTADDKKQQ